MDKDILRQYTDACALVRETEEEIRKIEKQRATVVQGTVKGSMPDFPYTEKHFRVSGLAYSVVSNPRILEEEEKILKERKQNAGRIKHQVEMWLNTIPPRMQRIIRFKIFERLTWDEVAIRMGRGATADSIKKEFQRFMEEK